MRVPVLLLLANQDPDTDASDFEFNHRFPGQYFDVETGTHYNYFRDYEPGTGRYVQSDPIGLDDGVNTYSYVINDPIDGFDELGLAKKSGSNPWWNNKSKCHVRKRHGDRNRYNGNGKESGKHGNKNRNTPNPKSKFCKPCNINKITKKTVKHPDVKILQSDGRTRYEKNHNKKLGTEGETCNVVILEPCGRVVTSFPSKTLSKK